MRNHARAGVRYRRCLTPWRDGPGCCHPSERSESRDLHLRFSQSAGRAQRRPRYASLARRFHAEHAEDRRGTRRTALQRIISHRHVAPFHAQLQSDFDGPAGKSCPRRRSGRVRCIREDPGPCRSPSPKQERSRGSDSLDRSTSLTLSNRQQCSCSSIRRMRSKSLRSRPLAATPNAFRSPVAARYSLTSRRDFSSVMAARRSALLAVLNFRKRGRIDQSNAESAFPWMKASIAA